MWLKNHVLNQTKYNYLQQHINDYKYEHIQVQVWWTYHEIEVIISTQDTLIMYSEVVNDDM